MPSIFEDYCFYGCDVVMQFGRWYQIFSEKNATSVLRIWNYDFMTVTPHILDFRIMILFCFAANITNISKEPAARTFKLPDGTKQHFFFSKTLTACKRHDILTQKFSIPVTSNMKFQI
jgi:hypothetical protein